MQKRKPYGQHLKSSPSVPIFYPCPSPKPYPPQNKAISHHECLIMTRKFNRESSTDARSCFMRKLRPALESMTWLLSPPPVFCYNSPPCSVSLDSVSERWFVSFGHPRPKLDLSDKLVRLVVHRCWSGSEQALLVVTSETASDGTAPVSVGTGG